MLVPYHLTETQKARHNRLLSMRIQKAKILSDRVNQFVKDINASIIYKDSEKKEILNNLKL
jgi:hypothetical protein